MTAPSAPPEPGEDGPQVVAYRLRWRPRSERPGAHQGHRDGGEGTFRGLVPLVARPDPRRIDMRAFIRDPFERVHVRAFAPRRAATVAALVDVSASMAFDGLGAEVAQLCATLAASAVAGGDAFALLAADEAARDDIELPPGRRRGLGEEVRARLAASFAGRTAEGLLAVTGRLPRRRCLVFLVSDFLMPEALREGLLDALWRHDVVPVVVRNSRAEGDVPALGLLEARDAESGGRRLVLMRPALRARWRAQAQARIAELDAAFARRGLAALHLLDRFDPDALVDFLARR